MIDWVFVSGWGMPKDVWKPLLAELPGSSVNQCFDLYGDEVASDFSLADGSFGDVFDYVVSQLAARVFKGGERQKVWVAWSLAGLVVMRLLQQFQRHKDPLVLLASTPYWQRDDDWSLGLVSEQLERFRRQYAQNSRRGFKRFCRAYVPEIASEIDRSCLESDLGVLLHQGAKAALSLRLLDFFLEVDLRGELSQWSGRVLALFGGHDPLLPMLGVEDFRQQCPDVASEVIVDAGHAVFWSHPKSVAQALQAFAARSM